MAIGIGAPSSTTERRSARASSEECQIDSIAQILGRVCRGPPSRQRRLRAMESVEERLVPKDLNLVLLFTPPFDKTAA